MSLRSKIKKVLTWFSWTDTMREIVSIEPPDMPANYFFPGLKRDFPDSTRPGLIHRVKPGQIWLDPDEIAAAREKWDEEHGVKS